MIFCENLVAAAKGNQVGLLENSANDQPQVVISSASIPTRMPQSAHSSAWCFHAMTQKIFSAKPEIRHDAHLRATLAQSGAITTGFAVLEAGPLLRWIAHTLFSEEHFDAQSDNTGSKPVGGIGEFLP